MLEDGCGDAGLYWAADVGGTKIRHAVVSGAGQLLEEWTADAATFADPADWVQASVAAWWDRSPARPGGIGIAAPAVVDAGGRLVSVPKLPHWEGANLTALFEASTGLRATVIFDAAAALAGELLIARPSWRNAALLTIGTGVGGALAIDGHVLNGAHGLAGMPAMTLEPEGVRVEEIASGPAVAAALGVPSGRHALALRDAGQPAAVQVFSRASHALYRTMAAISGTVDVDRFVITGGFGLAAYGHLFPEDRLPAQLCTYPVIHDDVRILAAMCGELAPIFGAAHRAGARGDTLSEGACHVGQSRKEIA